jgi:hypothetical protein
MKPRTPLNKMGREDEQPMTIAGKPADVCPYCGAVMLNHRKQETSHQIVRYRTCRNEKCGKSFVSSQGPERLVREVGGDDNSVCGKPSLTLVRESA